MHGPCAGKTCRVSTIISPHQRIQEDVGLAQLLGVAVACEVAAFAAFGCSCYLLRGAADAEGSGEFDAG